MRARRVRHWVACLGLVAASSAVAEPVLEETAVESLSATRHVNTVRLDALDSSYHIAAPEAALENERLVLRNLDARLPVILKLRAEGRPDLASADGMLRSILDDAMSPEEKAVAIWRFVVEWRYTYIPAEAGDESGEPVKLINVYGYGLCGNAAAAVDALSAAAGMPARVVGIGGHVVAEVWYENGWHMFDADHRVFYRDANGHIPSVAELASDPSPILATTHDPAGSPSDLMASMYTTTADNFLYPLTPASTHRIEPVLAPLDEVHFDFARGTVYSQSEESYALHSTYGAPPNYANGTLTRRLDVDQAGSDWTFPVEWPFLLLGGDVHLELASDDADAEISIACDGAIHTVVPSIRTGRILRASLRPFFVARRIGSYACSLRVRSLTPLSLGASLVAGQVDWLFQFAPRALQQVGSGGTSFRAELVPVDGPVPADWQGFEIVHAWGETHDFAAPGAQHFEQAAADGTDLVEAAASFDADSVVVTVLDTGDPNQRLDLYLDTDANSSTGYQQSALGADFRALSGRLSAYVGESSATNRPWNWWWIGPAPTAALRSDVRQVTIPTHALGLIAGGVLNLRARAVAIPSGPFDDLPRDDARWQVVVPHVVAQAGSADTDLVRAQIDFEATEMVVRLHTESAALENVHIYLDTDSNVASGYTHRSLGAEFLVENDFLYRHAGNEPNPWNWQNVAHLVRSRPQTNMLEVRIPLATLGQISGSATTLRIEHWRHWEARMDSLPRAENWQVSVPNIVRQTGASVGDLIAGRATVQPGSIVFTLEALGGPPRMLHLFMDSDGNPSTGYAYRSFGSDYLIQNDALLRFTAQPGSAPRWTRVGSVASRIVGPNTLEVVVPTAGLELSGRSASVFVENWQDWRTPLDSMPRGSGTWRLAW